MLLFVLSSVIFTYITAANNGYICSLDATGIDFGIMTPDSTSTSGTISTVTNNGTIPITSVSISGLDWEKTGGGSSISVGYTEWSTNDTTYYLMDYSPAPVSITPLETSHDIFFKLSIPNDQPAGDYTQQITLTFECLQ
jgi:hypothetical protein